MTMRAGIRLFIDRLYSFYFREYKGHYIVSALTFCVIFIYANISVLIFHQSERNVAFQGIMLAAVLLIGFPIAYNIGVVVKSWPQDHIADRNPQHSDVSSNRFQRLPGVSLLIKELFEKGYQRAQLSAAMKIRSTDLRVLEEYARAVALEIHTSPYDPQQNITDHLREEEYQKLRSERERVENALYLNVLPRVRNEEAKLAALKKNLTKPDSPRLFMVAAVIVISLCVAPILYDNLFFFLQDALLGWSISITGAILIANLIAWSMIGTNDATGGRSLTNISGLIAGVGISIALGVMKFSHAQTASEFIYSIALTIILVSTLFCLEGIAIAFRSNYRQWMEYMQQITKATAELEAAQLDLDRWQKQLATIDLEIKDHIAYIEERDIRHHKIADIESLAVKAVSDGYCQGIAHNRAAMLDKEK